jgi:hypothetical protein
MISARSTPKLTEAPISEGAVALTRLICPARRGGHGSTGRLVFCAIDYNLGKLALNVYLDNSPFAVNVMLF